MQSAKMQKFMCNNAKCKNAKMPAQQCKVQKCKKSIAGRCRSLNRSVGTLGFPLHWETRLVSIDKFEWEITSIAFLTWNVTFSFSHLFYAILPWKWNLLLRTVLCEVTKSYPSERVIWKPQCFFYKGIHFRTNCKSLPFFYFLTFEKGRLLYIHPVGRLVGWSVSRRHH